MAWDATQTNITKIEPKTKPRINPWFRRRKLFTAGSISGKSSPHHSNRRLDTKARVKGSRKTGAFRVKADFFKSFFLIIPNHESV
jgi:hypothetical protein